MLVFDPALGQIRLRWTAIATVELGPAPADAKPYSSRLWGRVRTTRASFEGFIQWDNQECVATDILDGDSEDGRLKVEMGRIKAIQRLSRSAARVELVDGRSLELSGTNDVDRSNRGIMVEDPRYGRVEVPWEAFERLELAPAPGSGPGYPSFAPGAALRGTVTAADGTEHRGRLVFDVDEAESWEILHGTSFDVDYLIPFATVAAVAPDGRHASQVTLRSGTTPAPRGRAGRERPQRRRRGSSPRRR